METVCDGDMALSVHAEKIRGEITYVLRVTSAVKVTLYDKFLP